MHRLNDMQNGEGERSAGEPAARTVLYIEDNPSNLQLIRKFFSRRADIKLISAHTPLLGIELALRERPSLVLLDINLPGMSGIDVLARLRGHPETQHVPAFAVTANAMPADRERALSSGFDAYVTKPLDLAAFMRLVDDYLTR